MQINSTQVSVEVAAVKANYFHASFRESLHYRYGKNKWMCRGVVHDSCSHGAVDRVSVRGRDGSFQRKKWKCTYLPESSLGSYWHVHVQNVKGVIPSPSGPHTEGAETSIWQWEPVQLSSSHGIRGISRIKLHALPPPK